MIDIRMKTLDQRAMAQWCSSLRIDREGRRPKRKRRLQMRIFQGLPGIEPGRAAELLARFRTVEAVRTAGRESLEQVEGIGGKAAAAIRDAMQRVPTGLW